MRRRTTMGVLAVGTVTFLASGCSATAQHPASAGGSIPPPEWVSQVDYGAIDELPADAVTRLLTPRQVFAVTTEGSLVLYDAKSPVLGCTLLDVDEETRATHALPADAVVWDPCHGAAFGRDGRRVDDPTCQAMTRFEFEIVDGRIIHDLHRPDAIVAGEGRPCAPGEGTVGGGSH